MPHVVTLRCYRAECARAFTVPYKQRDRKFCGHRCAAIFHQPKLIGAHTDPAVITRRSDTRRGSGNGPYVKRNGRHEHRAVAEQKIGRPLRRGEHVHHRDENPRNNHPDNLEVLSAAAHGRLHNLGKPKARRRASV